MSSTSNKVLVLRFAGPQQSWSGYRVSPDIIPTFRVPTRSGILGILAASLGMPRGNYEQWLVEGTEIMVRVDSRGEVAQDFQTVNPFPEDIGRILWKQEYLGGRVKTENNIEKRIIRGMIPIAGKPVLGMVPKNAKNRQSWMEGKVGSIMRKEFLANAEFIVTITHPERIYDIIAAVNRPIFTPYLGRKAFAPAFPFVLGSSVEYSALEVLEKIPTVQALTSTSKISKTIWYWDEETDQDAAADKYRELSVFRIIGDMNDRDREVVAVTKDTREGQLKWLQEHLQR